MCIYRATPLHTHLPAPLQVQYLERHVPMHERMAFYSVSDVAVVTATRDGMNLVPYEYIVCRQVWSGFGRDALTLTHYPPSRPSSRAAPLGVTATPRSVGPCWWSQVGV